MYDAGTLVISGIAAILLVIVVAGALRMPKNLREQQEKAEGILEKVAGRIGAAVEPVPAAPFFDKFPGYGKNRLSITKNGARYDYHMGFEKTGRRTARPVHRFVVEKPFKSKDYMEIVYPSVLGFRAFAKNEIVNGFSIRTQNDELAARLRSLAASAPEFLYLKDTAAEAVIMKPSILGKSEIITMIIPEGGQVPKAIIVSPSSNIEVADTAYEEALARFIQNGFSAMEKIVQAVED